MTRQKITSRGEGQCQQGNREPENQQTSKPEVPPAITHSLYWFGVRYRSRGLLPFA